MSFEDRKFSHSSMSTWRRCRVRYKWSYIDNLTTPSGIGQVRGTIGHSALGFWYSNRSNYPSFEELDEATMRHASDLLTVEETNRQQSLEKEWELLSVILPRYFDWARANDNFSEILGIEQKFEIQIGDFTVLGFIDGVVKINNSIWLLEHKFNKQVSTNHIDLDPQMSIYLLAAYKSGIEARGILYNVIRVAEGGIAQTSPVERRQVYRNLEGLGVVEHEIEQQLSEMKDFHINGGALYRNPTKDCSWDCSFYDACLSLNDSGDASKVLSRFPLRAPNPIDPIEKE